MQHIVQLDTNIFVAGQIAPEDVPDIAAGGFKLIVNNRPDGEGGADQPSAVEIESAAAAHGLDFASLPFTAPTLTAEHAARFAEILKEADGPILAYCRTGNRSSMLWAAASIALGAPLEEVLLMAGRAGYDLRAAAGFIEHLGREAASR